MATSSRPKRSNGGRLHATNPTATGIPTATARAAVSSTTVVDDAAAAGTRTDTAADRDRRADSHDEFTPRTAHRRPILHASADPVNAPPQRAGRHGSRSSTNATWRSCCQRALPRELASSAPSSAGTKSPAVCGNVEQRRAPRASAAMHEALAALTSWRPGSTRPSRPVRMKPSGYRRPTDDPHLPRRAHPRRRNAPSGAACDVAKKSPETRPESLTSFRATTPEREC